ncbi:MAG TPA: undecaprenyldiphospho-muramoylpentapeptide beta-N-acetylglucosaminyltransferase [Polyangia bacterium]|jgi:UDP-N-acetylglucosamine--N-acetylmuramyl-(pentapeptide) pyrophosphoryl-undecaprenol N-acetylglucosamine transferase
MTALRVLIAGGGTGGHLFPALALAEEIVARGGAVRFVGTAHGIEARAVPQAGHELALITVSGLKRTGVLGAARGLMKLPVALWQSLRIVGAFAPDVVVGVGGYASGPVVVAGLMRGRPTAILEQNSIPGVTNRILGRLVRRAYIALEPARGHFPARKTVLLGNPVRRAIREAAASPAGELPRVLVVGGSQGAHAVNEQVAAAVELLAARGVRLALTHQTGSADEAAIAARYAALGAAAGPLAARAFIDDMAGAYAGADLVVGRAGATTIAELSAIGRPAVLIPFPFAADNHQVVNARVLEQAGAARVLLQHELTPARLADTLAALLADEVALKRMATAMRGLGRPDAAARIADDLATLCATSGSAAARCA